MKVILLPFLLLFSLRVNAQIPNSIHVTEGLGEALHVYNDQLYFVDLNGYTIKKCNLDGTNVAALFDIPDINLNSYKINSIATNSLGDIFVVANAKVYKWNSVIGLTTSIEFPNVDPELNSICLAAWKMVIDSQDNLIIYDIGTGRIGKFQDGNNYGQILIDDDDSSIWEGDCFGLAVDQNNIYISETSNNRIIEYNISTNQETAILGTGQAGGGNGELSSPWGLHLKDNELYIADRGNYRLQRVNLNTGSVNTVAGRKCGSKYNRTCSASGVTIDSQDFVYSSGYGGINKTNTRPSHPIEFIRAHFPFENNLEEQVIGEDNSYDPGNLLYKSGLSGQSVELNYSNGPNRIGLNCFSCYELDAYWNNKEFTLSIWVKEEETTPYDNVIYLGADGYDSIGDGADNLGIVKELDNGEYYTSFSLSHDKPTSGKLQIPRAGIIDNQWNQYVLTFKNNEIKGYINGQYGGSVPTALEDITLDYFFMGVVNGIPSSYKVNFDEVKIYGKALSQSEITTLYNVESGVDLSNVQIEPLIEPINEGSYTVPREATVHHYFIVKDKNTGEKLKNAIVNYEYGPFLHQSAPSDTSGLIDLNIMVGGPNPTNSDDDWSPVGTQTVSFHSLAVGQVTGTNAFIPFDITIIDKIEPLDKESEISFGATVDIEALEVKSERIAETGGSKLFTGSGKIAAGITLGPKFSFKRNEANENIYHVTGGLGIAGTGTAEGELSQSFGVVNVSVNGGISAEVGISSALHFDLNLNDMGQCFKFARDLIGSSPFIPVNLFKTANFFVRASKLNSVPKNPFTLTGNVFGASILGEVNGKLKFNTHEKTIRDYQGYGRQLKTEGGIELELAGNIGYEVENDLDFFEGTTYTSTSTVGLEGKVNFDGMGRLAKKGDLNFWKVNLPFKVAEVSNLNEIVLENKYDLDGNPNGSSFSMKTQSVSTINPFHFQKINYVNSWHYGQGARETVTNAYLSSLASPVKDNALASFMYNNQTKFFSIIKDYPNPNGFVSQIQNLNKFVFDNYQTDWTNEDVSIETTREIVTEFNKVVGLDIPKLKLGFGELSFNYSNVYTHKYQESKYSKSLGVVLPTITLPDITSNLVLPQDNLLQNFWSKLNQFTETLPTALFNEAYDFVREETVLLINTIVCFTNGNCNSSLKANNAVRKNLNGNLIYDGSVKNSTLSNNPPSVLTITINPSPQVFSNTTSLKFEHFYPENQLQAITSTDTMRIISDVFLLFATDNSINVPIAPNGNFQISTVFSPTDLALASLPSGTLTKVIFKPHETNVWEVIGDVNATIQFNKTGTYAIAATIERDIISPTIDINFSQSTNNLGITFADNASGIDWANTQIIVNGRIVDFVRNGTGNTINTPISSLKSLPENTYFIQVLTYDFASNFASKEQIYPCDYKTTIASFEGRIDSPVYEEALKSLETNAKLPSNKSVFLKSGGDILLKPGFETKGSVFKAEIGGCNN